MMGEQLWIREIKSNGTIVSKKNLKKKSKFYKILKVEELYRNLRNSREF